MSWCIIFILTSVHRGDGRTRQQKRRQLAKQGKWNRKSEPSVESEANKLTLPSISNGRSTCWGTELSHNALVVLLPVSVVTSISLVSHDWMNWLSERRGPCEWVSECGKNPWLHIVTVRNVLPASYLLCSHTQADAGYCLNLHSLNTALPTLNLNVVQRYMLRSLDNSRAYFKHKYLQTGPC